MKTPHNPNQLTNEYRRKRFIKIVTLCSLASVLVLTSCKDDKVKSKEEAARFNKSANTYLIQGQFRAAVLEAKNAVEKDSQNAEGYIVLGKIYNEMGSFLGTQKMLEGVVKKLPEVSLELADAYVANKKYRSALSLLADYKAEKPEAEARKLILMARSAIHLGDNKIYEESMVALAKLPENKDDFTFLEIESLIAKGQGEAAQEKLDALPSESAQDVKKLIILGGFALQRNQLDKAEKLLSKALGLLPNTDIMTADKTQVLSGLTEVLIQQGKASEAYKYQKILAEANPDSQGAQQKYSDALEYYRQGKFSEAAKVLVELREQFPQDKNTAVLLGMTEYQQGKNEQATELFDKFIDPENTAPTIIEAAALAKYRSNKTGEAIELLKKAVENQPNNAELLATYGMALLDRDPVSVEGERAIEKSLVLNPKKHRLRLVLAKRNLANKNPIQALAQLKKAYSDDPLDLIIQQSYFRELINQGKKDELKREVAEFQKENPNNARGFFLEGWSKLVQKDYSGAQLAFEKSLSTKGNTEKALSYSGLAQVFQAQNQPQKALVTWQSLIEEQPEQVQAYSQWLKLIGQLKRVDDAADFLSALEKKTDKWQPSVVFAQLLFSQGKVSEAVAHIDVALERSGKNAQVKQVAANLYEAYGRKLNKEKNPEEAKKFLLKALNFFPDNMNYLAGLVEFEIGQKDIPEAQKLLDQFSSSEDVAAELLYLQGVIRNAEGKQDEAQKLFQDSWTKKPMDVVAETIFTAYQKAGNKEQAQKFVDEWVVKLPKSPRPALMKAVRAQENKDIADAIKWYEKTIELAPNLSAALNNLAWIYYEQKNPKAQELAKRAYEISANNPAVADTYGWILVENNQLEEGTAILEKAVSLDSTNKEIVEHLKLAKSRKK